MYLYQYENLKVEALSIGGIENCFVLPEHDIAIDVGRCPERIVNVPVIFLTHGHLDHSAGLPYYFSQRSLKGKPPGMVYVPVKTAGRLKKICKLWHKVENFKYDISIVPIKPKTEIFIKNKYFIRSLSSYHRIESLAYALIRKTTKLKKEYLKLPGNKIKELKEQNVDIFENKEICEAVFSGDTTIEFIKNTPEAKNAKVLFLECTYIDKKRTVERARKWGHIHLDEIIENQEIFQNEKIVFSHFSRRYTSSYIKSVLNKKLPVHLKNKVDMIFF
ncbi:MAG: MBL fold metallo-hydrolase [Spirochaetia bacterium]|nr:MBL fold metallo-hydrolase [Spirochaetia bacterium]